MPGNPRTMKQREKSSKQTFCLDPPCLPHSSERLRWTCKGEHAKIPFLKTGFYLNFFRQERGKVKGFLLSLLFLNIQLKNQYPREHILGHQHFGSLYCILQKWFIDWKGRSCKVQVKKTYILWQFWYILYEIFSINSTEKQQAMIGILHVFKD